MDDECWSCTREQPPIIKDDILLSGMLSHSPTNMLSEVLPSTFLTRTIIPSPHSSSENPMRAGSLDILRRQNSIQNSIQNQVLCHSSTPSTPGSCETHPSFDDYDGISTSSTNSLNASLPINALSPTGYPQQFSVERQYVANKASYESGCQSTVIVKNEAEDLNNFEDFHMCEDIRDDYFNDFIDSGPSGDLNYFDEGLVDDDDKFTCDVNCQSDDSSFIPSAAPPPIPPSKIRSKMHDLAVRHRLITNQNTRGQGQLNLSSEEKRTLIQEGYSIPTKLPLTRDEEESLKIIRRKIKNKLSAQESRRKRKEYMDCLEKKAHGYYADNMCLKQRIRQLERANLDLAAQLKNFQSMVSSNNGQRL